MNISLTVCLADTVQKVADNIQDITEFGDLPWQPLRYVAI
jgi:hypothetical protein